MYRRTAERLCGEAARIDPAVAARLRVFASIRDCYRDMSDALNAHCAVVGRFMMGHHPQRVLADNMPYR